MKLHKSGSIYTEDGKVLIVSWSVFRKTLQDLLPEKYLKLVDEYLDKDAVLMDLHGEEITVSVDEAFSVSKDGYLFSVPVIGFDHDNHLRLLEKGEKTLVEFAKDHRSYRKDLIESDDAYQLILREYTDYLLKRTSRYNPALDKALGVD